MGILDIIKESLMVGVRDFARNIESEISGRLMQKIYLIKKKIMKELLAIFIILISIGLLAISGIFFLIEYLHLNKTLSFLIIGIIILVIGILTKLSN